MSRNAFREITQDTGTITREAIGRFVNPVREWHRVLWKACVISSVVMFIALMVTALFTEGSKITIVTVPALMLAAVIFCGAMIYAAAYLSWNTRETFRGFRR